ncbi:unannotated protein [freshwater metagenome]|uniref:Unannotated protein n=1 Tax=freshwater metagenome TaxID=449393 RepID=A0A6J7DGT7_9ZZZZ|nr:hypothetical protein [Actinomycetota bacterium]
MTTAFTGPHAELALAAIELEAVAHRALFDGDADLARRSLRAAAVVYRESWTLAPPGSWGRLLGMLKAAVLADPELAASCARYALDALNAAGAADESPPTAYVAALCAVIHGDDAQALRAIEGMRTGSPAFVRTAAAIEALARGDAAAYAQALGEIVRSFETRDEHLSGVAIADTAMMLERLAQPRGLAAVPGPSPVLPA